MRTFIIPMLEYVAQWAAPEYNHEGFLRVQLDDAAIAGGVVPMGVSGVGAQQYDSDLGAFIAQG